MKTPHQLLFIITSDPGKDWHPAEAIRVAAGVGAWGKVSIDLYLGGPAVRCLDDFAEELEDGQLIAQYLPAIEQHGGQILVESSPPAGSQARQMSRQELARLISGYDSVIRC